MKPKRTLAGVEADHKSKGLMREANRTALWGLLGIPTFCTNTLLASLQALSHNSCCSAECHPQLAEIRILLLFHISTAKRIGLSENTHPLMSWVESLVWNAGSKRWFTQEGEDMQLLVPKNGDSPIFNVIFLWLGFFSTWDSRDFQNKLGLLWNWEGKSISSETVNERVGEEEIVEDWGVMRQLCRSEEMPSVLCQSLCSWGISWVGHDVQGGKSPTKSWLGQSWSWQRRSRPELFVEQWSLLPKPSAEIFGAEYPKNG